MNLVKSLLAIGLLALSSESMSAGRITSIAFSGPDDPNHINIVQIEIEGGFSGEGNAQGCNPSLAAIRNSPDRQYLISYLLTAYATKEKIKLVLNPTDKYLNDRCTISRIASST